MIKCVGTKNCVKLFAFDIYFQNVGLNTESMVDVKMQPISLKSSKKCTEIAFEEPFVLGKKQTYPLINIHQKKN